MSELLIILQNQRTILARAVAEGLEQADCRELQKTRGGQPEVLLDTLTACTADSDEAPVRQWLHGLRPESGKGTVPWREILLGLSVLEAAGEGAVEEQIAEKPVRQAAFSELHRAVDRLRAGYLQQLVQGSEIPTAASFAAVAEDSGDCIYVAGAHGEPFYLNPAGRRLLGLPEEKSVSQIPLHDLYTPDSWQQLRDVAVPEVNKTGHWRGQSRLRQPPGEEPIEVQTTILRVRLTEAPRPLGLALIHRDLSDRARLERTLAESEARKHAILESALDPIITIDHEGFITEFNRAAEQVFGYSRDRILGTRPTDLLFPPSMDPQQKERIERYLTAGEGSMLGKRAEVTAVRADGRTFPAEMAMTISHERGSPVLSFFVRDISQRKKAEQEQARYAAELERSNRELEQFAYVASHDLQEPLRKIRTFSGRLLERKADRLDEEIRDDLNRIQKSAARMQALIDGLLTLSRVSTRPQNYLPVDLGHVVGEVTADLEEQIRHVQGRVEMGRLPTIQADPLQMRQLFQNLIANGLKFHRSEEPPVIRVSGRYLRGRNEGPAKSQPGEEYCRILVEDNGIGFEEKHCDRIFGVFQRLHPRDVYEGTGIGLAVCRRIVERHGGQIAAQGLLGQGSRFEIFLPIRQAKERTENEEFT
ncbi:MAG: PAS domain S-box protein [Pirellulales bacterium]|nr:PAS domain S-box protein [Pirellulales bacterium]